MIKLVIFDLDNTLMDFMRMKESAVDAAAEAMIDSGLEMNKEEIKSSLYEVYERKGIEYQKVFNEFLKKKLGRIDEKIMASGIVAYRRAREAALVLYPHVNLTLMELVKIGMKLAVLSDAPRRQAWLRLCYLQLHHYFDSVITYEDTGQRKPHPLPFRRVLEDIGIEPHEAIMVGDWAERDIVGAKSVGITTVFACYGDRFNTVNSGSDYEIDDLKQLIGIVKSINNS